VKQGKRRLELVLEPVAARALELAKGEVLRITQLEGGQGVDFNCFSIDDHKEYMAVGHMRREDFRVGPGRFLWSNPPRFRPMMQVLSMSRGSVADTLAPRCSAAVVESQYGIDDHPNCQDTLAEAIGEYGLTPDDVHDPLNLWRNTAVDHIGFYDGWNRARAGDAIELLAVMDVLAVPAICGLGNLSVSGNFSYKPVKLEVFGSSAQSRAAAAQAWKTHASLKSQKLPDQFLNPTIRTEPALQTAAGYEAQFINYPIEWREIEVLFSDQEFRSLWKYRGTLGDTDEEVVRTLFLHWYLDNRKKQGLRWYLPKNAHA
jgi:uncharacterized protein YcgI (DUF1989 family)